MTNSYLLKHINGFGISLSCSLLARLDLRYAVCGDGQYACELDCCCLTSFGETHTKRRDARRRPFKEANGERGGCSERDRRQTWSLGLAGRPSTLGQLSGRLADIRWLAEELRELACGPGLAD